MASVLEKTLTDEELGLPSSLPDHKELPESDGTFVMNFQEHPQSMIITESLWPMLENRNVEMPWLRVWDSDGNLLPTDQERADTEAERANAEAERADAEANRADTQSQRAELLAAKLRELGIDPDEITST